MKKAPANKVSKERSVDPGFKNPFDSDSDSEQKPTSKPARTSSAPLNINGGGQQQLGASSAAKNHYKNDFRDVGGLENQSMQELEGYAVYKAEETTKAVHGCLKIAEEIREDATKTLVMLHEQGEQITRTHQTAANIDHDLSMGEKILGSLGGMFSKTWKPKKTRAITGPVIISDDSYKRKANGQEQRDKLGLGQNPKAQSKSPQSNSEPSTALEKVEVEKAKQDDALSDLSNVLDQLKDMAVDMGSEIERQNKALDHLYDDVEELNHRMKGANERGRRLLAK